MKAFLLLLSLTAFLAAAPARAIDPGTAQGWLQVDGGEVSQLTHAYVYRERPQEMLILVADREIPSSALPRIEASAVTKMALEGRLRGVLIQVDPARPKNAFLTPLSTKVSRTKSGAVRNLTTEHNRVSGEIESFPGDVFEFAYRATFSAPLFSGYGTVPGGGVKQ